MRCELRCGRGCVEIEMHGWLAEVCIEVKGLYSSCEV